MRVPYKWLKQYVDLDISAQELAEKMTFAGLELDEIIERGADICGVVVARVLSAEPIAGSDHLKRCLVDAGQGEPLIVVCGAPNAAAGQLAACALPGARLPGGFTVEKRKTFGVESAGMLCSQQELGLSEDHSGIWVLDAALSGREAPLGADIVDALDLRDQVLVIDLTPNRSDCLGILNCAREAAALTGAAFTAPDLDYPEAGPEAAAGIEIEIEDTALCTRYVGRIVRGLNIGPSPQWMQNYLLAAGMRPINNLVDISNFVMLEYNQPLHIFDYDQLRGQRVIVRAARPHETMQTLDGKQRTFTAGEILICDAERAVCIGGVMGGRETEVTEQTQNVLIESACFHPASIRRTARRHGIPSEAEARFEKGVDAAACDLAARRAAQLMVRYCGGVADRGAVEARAEQYAEGFPQNEILLRPERVNQILGTAFSAAEISDVMRRLGFGLESRDDGLLVRAPSYRIDISLEIDLIEEVARLCGYHQIPQTLPATSAQGGRSPRQQLMLSLKRAAAAHGLFETLNYSFISPREADRLRLPPDHAWRRTLNIANPLSEEQSVMRRSLLPGLLNTAARNQSRRNLDLRLFEMGSVFVPDAVNATENQPQEIPMLALLLAGAPQEGWQQAGAPYDFYWLKGIAEGILAALGLCGLAYGRADAPFLHPGRSAEISLNGQYLGLAGELHPAVAANYELAGRLTVAELALPPVFQLALEQGNRAHDLPRYPASYRDIALIGSADTAADLIGQGIIEAGGEYIRAARLFDLYDKPPIPAGQRSLAYALEFRAEDRTLTDQEVDAAFAAIVRAMQEKYAYRLR